MTMIADNSEWVESGQARKLERIKRFRTRYELTAVHPDGRRVLIVYMADKSRTSMMRCLCDNTRRSAVVALTGTDVIRFGRRAADGGTMGEWSIRWSGRTQREAIIGGELPFVCRAEIGGGE